MSRRGRLVLLSAIVCLLIPAIVLQQFYANITVLKNVEYVDRDGYASAVDVYLQPGSRPRPTLIYFHGGGWLPSTSKDRVRIARLPFLWLGWNVVNVEYRNSAIATAPAAVEDALCALAWVGRTAGQYHFDPDRLVSMGDSAGGALALIVGMAPATAPLNRPCPGAKPRVAAIVDRWGITDLSTLIEGSDIRTLAMAWVGNARDPSETAARVSPMSYIRPGLPPVFIVHSIDDPIVPYAQSAALHDALDAAGVRNRLMTLSGAAHGTVGKITKLKIDWATMRFLYKIGL